MGSTYGVRAVGVLNLDISYLFPEVILKFRDLIEKLEKDIYAVMRLEKEEREMAHSEAQVRSRHTPQNYMSKNEGQGLLNLVAGFVCPSRSVRPRRS